MTEIKHLIIQLEDAWNGEPWFGRPALQLLDGITDTEAYFQPLGQHSIAALVWHMAYWRAFVLRRFEANGAADIDALEGGDWQPVSPDGPNNWAAVWLQLQQTQDKLLAGLAGLAEKDLDQPVEGRAYSVRSMLQGIVHHDIYHLGQIAYIRKLWHANKGEE